MKSQVKKHNLGYRMSGDMRMHGGAWYDDLWSGIKSVAEPVLDIAKKTGAISKLAGAFGQPEVAAVASSLGYGRRKGRRMKGKGMSSGSNPIIKC